MLNTNDNQVSGAGLRSSRITNKTFFFALTKAATSPQARALLSAAYASPLQVEKHAAIPRGPNSLLVLTRGWVCSQRPMRNGSRQILRVSTPGELCNPWVLYEDDLDIDLVATMPSRLLVLPSDRLKALPDEEIFKVLQENSAREHLLLIEALVMLGRMSARERVAYFLLELVDRLQRSGLALDDSFMLGMTQCDLADALGISTVHANRAIHDLKADGLIDVSGKHYDIIDRARLEALVCFKPRASSNGIFPQRGL